jgi:hypothetical protein
VTVQRRARGKDRCIAGWHRSRALALLARDGYTDPLGEHYSYEQLAEHVSLPPKGKLPIEPLHVSDDVALQKLIQDNRANDVATNDDEMLARILRGMAEEDRLLGTGYDGDDVDNLIAALAAGSVDPANARRGDAATSDGDAAYGVVIECRDEADQSALLEELLGRGLRVRALTL